MTDNNKPTVVAHISDIHVGEAYFVPSLLTRAIDEINELNPDVVILTGDLTAMGFRREYDTVQELFISHQMQKPYRAAREP
jgi:3',5'-cyclic-AMP phosphodiesterase